MPDGLKVSEYPSITPEILNTSILPISEMRTGEEGPEMAGTKKITVLQLARMAANTPSASVVFTEAGTQTAVIAAARNTILNMTRTYEAGGASVLRLNGTALSLGDVVTVNCYAGQPSGNGTFTIANNAGTALRSTFTLAVGQMATLVVRKGSAADTWGVVAFTVNNNVKNIADHSLTETPIAGKVTFAYRGASFIFEMHDMPGHGQTFEVTADALTIEYVWDNGGGGLPVGRTPVTLGGSYGVALDNLFTQLLADFDCAAGTARSYFGQKTRMLTFDNTVTLASVTIDPLVGFPLAPLNPTVAEILPRLDSRGLANVPQPLFPLQLVTNLTGGFVTVGTEGGPDAPIYLFLQGQSDYFVVGIIPANQAAGVYTLSSFLFDEWRYIFDESFQYPSDTQLVAVMDGAMTNNSFLSISVQALGTVTLTH